MCHFINLAEALHLYITKHVDPGDFLQAVLANDLKEAFARADEGNTEDMHHIVSYIYQKVPRAVWGSWAIVKAHLEGAQP